VSFRRSHISISSQFKVILCLALVITVVELINLFLGRSLNALGLIPREVGGLIGVATAPFLHGSLMHYFSNIVPLCIFAFLLLQHGAVRFGLVSIVIISLSGILVWLFGRTAIHVGASGLIYGYFGYLLVAGWLSREIKLLAISLFVGVGYGSMIWGVLPSMPFVSWEYHLFGFLSGIFAAMRWGHAQE
jgi:membrane associated rhomboid family serine protease